MDFQVQAIAPGESARFRLGPLERDGHLVVRAVSGSLESVFVSALLVGNRYRLNGLTPATQLDVDVSGVPRGLPATVVLENRGTSDSEVEVRFSGLR